MYKTCQLAHQVLMLNSDHSGSVDTYPSCVQTTKQINGLWWHPFIYAGLLLREILATISRNNPYETWMAASHKSSDSAKAPSYSILNSFCVLHQSTRTSKTLTRRWTSDLDPNFVPPPLNPVSCWLGGGSCSYHIPLKGYCVRRYRWGEFIVSYHRTSLTFPQGNWHLCNKRIKWSLSCCRTSHCRVYDTFQPTMLCKIFI